MKLVGADFLSYIRKFLTWLLDIMIKRSYSFQFTFIFITFLYRYDERGRMVMKKVPGADSVLMFYDQWDRIVLTQDSNLRAGHNFLFTKYDGLNRPVITGQINDTRTLDLV